MRTFNVAIILAAGGLLPACATIVRGTEQDVSIVSEPPEALARLSNGMSCTTPCSVELDRRENVTVTVTKAGYEPSETQIVSKMRGSDYLLGIGGNVMVGGVVGAVIDGNNGAMRSLEPSPLNIKLRPWGPTATPPVVQLVSASHSSVQPSTPATFRPAAVNAAPPIPRCDGVPGVPAGVSSYSVGPEPGETRSILICDDPTRR